MRLNTSIKLLLGCGMASTLYANSFFIGGDLGYQNMPTRTNRTSSISTLKQALFAEGARGGLFLGYDLALNQRADLAILLKGSLNNISLNSVQNTNPLDQYNQKLSSTYGFSFQPGYFISDHTRLYADLGLARGYFKTSENFNNTIISSDNLSRTGLEWGAGLGTFLTDNLELRAQYLQTHYQSWQFMSNVANGGLLSTRTNTEHPITSEATLGLSYYFERNLNWHDCELITAARQGFYVGIDAGYSRLNDKVSVADSVSRVVQQTLNLYGDGARGGLFAGYNFDLGNNFVTGIEAKANLTNAATNIVFTAAGTRIEANQKQHGSYNLSLRPGYYIASNTKLVADLGWSHARFTQADTQINPIPSANSSASLWLNGLQFGGGIETNLSSKFALRTEYLATRYSSHAWNDTVGGTTNNERPTTYELNVGIVYKLDNL